MCDFDRVNVLVLDTLECLPGIALALDVDGLIIHWNSACVELTGKGPEQVLGLPLSQVLAEAQEVQCVDQVLEAVRVGTSTQTFECQWVLATGERRSLAFTGASAPGPDAGRPVLVFTGVDVTQIVTPREEELARMRALVEQAPDGIFIADLEGKFTDVNDAGCRMLGYTREDMLGMSIVDIISSEQEERLWEARERMRSGAIAVGDWMLRRRDGSSVATEVSAKILPDGRWEGMARELSGRSEFESALRERLAAQRAIAARDEALATVAHELRTPLNTILLHVEILRRRIPNGHRSIESIRRAATRMGRLVMDMLDVTRLDAGSLALAPELFAVQDMLDEAVDTHLEDATSAQLDLRLDVTDPLPELLADRDRILQVLDNLIGNAIKFTAAGGCVEVGAASRTNTVLFWVADTGAGISFERMTHVFKRFWQATDDSFRGAGLGLPIAKGIVEAHGGTIWVESSPGPGSTFYFTLPSL
jgi:PAS domain S-box-containing protein